MNPSSTALEKMITQAEINNQNVVASQASPDDQLYELVKKHLRYLTPRVWQILNQQVKLSGDARVLTYEMTALREISLAENYYALANYNVAAIPMILESNPHLTKLFCHDLKGEELDLRGVAKSGLVFGCDWTTVKTIVSSPERPIGELIIRNSSQDIDYSQCAIRELAVADCIPMDKLPRGDCATSLEELRMCGDLKQLHNLPSLKRLYLDSGRGVGCYTKLGSGLDSLEFIEMSGSSLWLDFAEAELPSLREIHCDGAFPVNLHEFLAKTGQQIRVVAHGSWWNGVDILDNSLVTHLKDYERSHEHFPAGVEPHKSDSSYSHTSRTHKAILHSASVNADRSEAYKCGARGERYSVENKRELGEYLEGLAVNDSQ